MFKGLIIIFYDIKIFANLFQIQSVKQIKSFFLTYGKDFTEAYILISTKNKYYKKYLDFIFRLMYNKNSKI